MELDDELNYERSWTGSNPVGPTLILMGMFSGFDSSGQVLEYRPLVNVKYKRKINAKLINKVAGLFNMNKLALA